MKNPLRRAKSNDSYRGSESSSKVTLDHEALSRTHSENTQKSGLFEKLRTRIRRPSLGLARVEQDDHGFLQSGNRTVAARLNPPGDRSRLVSANSTSTAHSSLRGRRCIPVPLTIHAESEVSSESAQSSFRQVRHHVASRTLSETAAKSVSPTTPPKVPERSLVSLGLVPFTPPKSSTPSPKMQSTDTREQYEVPLNDSSPLSPLSPFVNRQTGSLPIKAAKPLPPLPVASFDDLHPDIPEVAEEESDIPEELAPVPPTSLDYRPDHESISVTSELRKLFRCGWYWGPIARSEAEKRMEDHPDGAFLVRNSHDSHHLLTLTFRSLSKTLHARIDYENGKFSFHPLLDREAFPSVVELVENAMKKATVCYSRSREPDSPTFPVQLITPVSRFSEVGSLKYLCRFVIRLHIRADHLADTPLPDSIRKFLSTLNS